MEPILFYRYTCPPRRPAAIPSAAPWVAEIWRPTGLQLAPSCGLSTLARLAWVGFHHLRIFRNRHHAVILLRQPGGACVHRTLLFPPYFRFPFMARDDLQCGDLWTHPDERGHGLAGIGLALALHQAWQPGRHLWYLTEASNAASCRLAAKAGFQLAGRGRRTAPLGLKSAGQFVMTMETQSVR